MEYAKFDLRHDDYRVVEALCHAREKAAQLLFASESAAIMRKKIDFEERMQMVDTLSIYLMGMDLKLPPKPATVEPFEISAKIDEGLRNAFAEQLQELAQRGDRAEWLVGVLGLALVDPNASAWFNRCSATVPWDEFRSLNPVDALAAAMARYPEGVPVEDAHAGVGTGMLDRQFNPVDTGMAQTSIGTGMETKQHLKQFADFRTLVRNRITLRLQRAVSNDEVQSVDHAIAAGWDAAKNVGTVTQYILKTRYGIDPEPVFGESTKLDYPEWMQAMRKHAAEKNLIELHPQMFAPDFAYYFREAFEAGKLPQDAVDVVYSRYIESQAQDRERDTKTMQEHQQAVTDEGFRKASGEGYYDTDDEED